MDATHTKFRYNNRTPQAILQEQAKKLRKAIYEIDESAKERLPEKNTENSLEKELDYCQKLIDVIESDEVLKSYPKVSEKANTLKESVQDDLEHLQTSIDADAKTGHKTADSSFFGYACKYKRQMPGLEKIVAIIDSREIDLLNFDDLDSYESV